MAHDEYEHDEHEHVRDCDCRVCAIQTRDHALEALRRAESALIEAWADAWHRSGPRTTRCEALAKARTKYSREIICNE